METTAAMAIGATAMLLGRVLRRMRLIGSGRLSGSVMLLVNALLTAAWAYENGVLAWSAVFTLSTYFAEATLASTALHLAAQETRSEAQGVQPYRDEPKPHRTLEADR